MVHLRAQRVRRVVAAGALGVLLSACAGRAGPAPGTTGPAAGGGTELRTAEVPGVGTVLTTPDGFTLYVFRPEADGTIQCTGDCAATWPPLLAPYGRVPALAAGVEGEVGTATRPDGGVQVTYNGMPLYRYSGDAEPGQANGQGLGGVWFAATPGQAGGASPTTGGPAYPDY